MAVRQLPILYRQCQSFGKQGSCDGKLQVLVQNIIESADSAIKNRSIAATLRFGHDGNVIPLLALLQVENFDVSVAGPAEVYKHWCDFKASPMAANIQIVFFENKKGDIW